ncbi:hypothetical protein HMPREF6745_0966 [Prevotella sp. oral taxon 472 str. F0295]|nr:hypothetical protein HMPREF6745_0966 [Prevotella sp. oral taxon 472 str. F0295]
MTRKRTFRETRKEKYSRAFRVVKTKDVRFPHLPSSPKNTTFASVLKVIIKRFAQLAKAIGQASTAQINPLSLSNQAPNIKAN